MELSYWQSRWRKGNIGFHMKEGYPGLRKHWPQLGIPSKSVVLVPLCGKSRDLIWLSGRAEKVIGVEISDAAIRAFFEENGLTATKAKSSGFNVFTSGNLELWCGDFRNLPPHAFKNGDLIYDKSAIIALPPAMRKEYADKLISLASSQTKMLVQHIEYAQDEMNGPPFSVSPEELFGYFSEQFAIKQLEKTTLNPDNYQKFQKRGLKTYLIEYLSLLSRIKNN